MFRAMRRVNCQLSTEAAEKILRGGDYGVLSLSGDDGYPYAVPINYAVEGNKIYFHSAKTGHKLDAINNNDKVSIDIVRRMVKEYSPNYKQLLNYDVSGMSKEKLKQIIKDDYDKFINSKPLLSENKNLTEEI